MRLSGARGRLVFGALLAVVIAFGARSFASTPHKVPTGRAVVFTCCRAADVDHIYHPGDTVRIHWIAHNMPRASLVGQPVPVTLSARILTGPRSVAAAKRPGARTTVLVHGTPVHVSEQSFGRPPVSQVKLPDDLAPGLYPLVTTVRDEGTESATTGIQVRSR